MLITATAQTRKRKLYLDDRASFDAAIAALPENTRLVVQVKRENRSNSQNAYYWAVVLPAIAEYTGESVGRLHEVMKVIFLGYQFITIGGKEMAIPNSSAALDKAQFAAYVGQIMAWAATELGVAIPPPTGSE